MSSPWKLVSWSMDCGPERECSVCDEEYGVCPCPGPMMEEYEYESRGDELYAHLKDLIEQEEPPQ